MKRLINLSLYCSFKGEIGKVLDFCIRNAFSVHYKPPRIIISNKLEISSHLNAEVPQDPVLRATFFQFLFSFSLKYIFPFYDICVLAPVLKNLHYIHSKYLSSTR